MGDDSLRTLGKVTLPTVTPGAAITQFPLSRILARDLVIDARGDVVLEASANRVETFGGAAVLGQTLVVTEGDPFLFCP